MGLIRSGRDLGPAPALFSGGKGAFAPDTVDAGVRAHYVTPLAAGVAKLADAPDLGSGDESRGGSSPSARTSRRRSARADSRLSRNPGSSSHASDRNAVDRPQARVQGGDRRPGPAGEGRRTPQRAQ